MSETPRRLSLLTCDHPKQHKTKLKESDETTTTESLSCTHEGPTLPGSPQATNMPCSPNGTTQGQGNSYPTTASSPGLSLFSHYQPLVSVSKDSRQLPRAVGLTNILLLGHSPLFCVLFKGLDHTTDILHSCLSKTYPTPAQAGESFLLMLPGL